MFYHNNNKPIKTVASLLSNANHPNDNDQHGYETVSEATSCFKSQNPFDPVGSIAMGDV